MYLLRLDDASEYMNWEKWSKVEEVLDKHGICAIYGIIPNNQDPALLEYEKVENFWAIVKSWQDKGWIPALHGYTHKFETECGGLNPVNRKSEFAGLELSKQREKIKKGYNILKEKDIDPHIFFAPAHTFDESTLKALKFETSIRVISDTVANDLYYRDSIFFIPQQSGKVRWLPFKIVTFCYHPNVMSDNDIKKLDRFITKNIKKFKSYEEISFVKRNKSFIDLLLEKLYFFLHKVRHFRYGGKMNYVNTR